MNTLEEMWADYEASVMVDDSERERGNAKLAFFACAVRILHTLRECAMRNDQQLAAVTISGWQTELRNFSAAMEEEIARRDQEMS